MIMQDKEELKGQTGRGCGILLLVVLMSLWVLLLSGIDLFASWILEQTLFQSSVGISDIRWVLHLVTFLLIFIPLLILNFAVKNPRMKLAFRLWMLASILGLLTVPMKTLYLTAQNETALLQIASMGLLLAVLLVFKKPASLSEKEAASSLPRSGMTGFAVILAAAITIPWLLWGALGSLVDTVLELLVGVLFGVLVVQLAFPQYLNRVHTSDRELRISDFILDGFILFIFLLIMVTGLAHNGSQVMLVITVPISGWVLAAFSIGGIGRRGRGKFGAGLIAAAALAAPLLFFDMDELSLVIGSGAGEVLSWALKAAWFTFMALIAIFVVLLINFHFIENAHLPRKWNMGLAGFGIVAVVVVYLLWGQIGFFGEKLFVVLKTQADLTAQASIEDYSVRRQAVYRELTTFAEVEQASIRSVLKKMHVQFTPYYLVNGLEVDGGPFIKMALLKNDAVERILDDPQLRPLPQPVSAGDAQTQDLPQQPAWNLTMIHADQVKSELGITGQGIIIGQTDSGVDGKHPQLSSNYRGVASGDDYNWFDPWNASQIPVDLIGHGTMTLGIAAGKDIGIAPDAQWIGCVNLARNLGNPARYLDCMQFMLAPFPQNADPFTDGDPSQGAMVVNNSWGCPTVEGCDAQVFEGAAAALETAGIFLSAGAGNTGDYGCSSVTDPIAIYPSVFTVGSVNQGGDLSTFSSVGPVIVDGSDRQKPDLLAPGEQITSAFPGAGYNTADGTSFAAPHVTGVVALMWSANPALIGDVEATMAILRQTAQPYTGVIVDCGQEGSTVGAGILDAYAAVQAALAWK